jgi:KamA family protein
VRIFRNTQLADLPQVASLSDELKHQMRAVATILPFKVNEYVLDELIDWSAAPDDPIFRLTFPAKGMLPDHVFNGVSKLLRDGADARTVKAAVSEWRKDLNPHPSGQTSHNVPEIDGVPIPGFQHKYRETLLAFPSQGQTCHAYCGYCFRWAQFVGETELKFASSQPTTMDEYLKRHREVTDVLFTGGDPLVMATSVLQRWVEPLLAPELQHVTTIRLGTKALAYWPRRLTSTDGSELLRLVERCVAAGRNVAVMMHVSHPRELETNTAREAVGLLQSAGAVLRSQAPIIRHVNDDGQVWAQMWRRSVDLGIQPYYAFVERDTGASAYFAVPLARALEIYQEAQRSVSGLARTARGPVMSANPGKLVINGYATVNAERVFVLSMLQARDPDLVGRTFFARYSESAVWIDGLQPAFCDAWPWEDMEPAHGQGEVAAARHA